MYFRNAISKALSLSLAVVMCPLPAACLSPEQVQPTSGLVEAVEHLDKCEVEAQNKNLAVAKDWCQRGLTVLNRTRIQNEEAGRLRAKLTQRLAEVNEADKNLDRKTRAAHDLAKQAKLDSARQALNEVEPYRADRRYQEATSDLAMRQAEFDRALKEAQNHEQAAQKKQAHFKYKEAQALNRDASLGTEIKRTSGCYAGCKTVIWIVVLAAGGAGGYYAYKESEKNKAAGR